MKRVRARAKYGIAGDLTNLSIKDDRGADRLYTSRLRLSDDRRTEHELVVARDFVRHLGVGVELADVWPGTWTSPDDRRWAEATVPDGTRRITLGLVPSTSGRNAKIYPPEHYPSAVAEALPAPVDVVIFGSPADREVCARTAAALEGRRGISSVRNLAGGTTVGQLIEGLKRVSVVLSVDAAPLHLATALRRPTVGIMGGGHFGRFYPWGDPDLNRVANHPMDCYWCYWRCRYPTTRCVEEIAPEVIATELAAAFSAGTRVPTGRVG